MIISSDFGEFCNFSLLFLPIQNFPAASWLLLNFRNFDIIIKKRVQKIMSILQLPIWLDHQQITAIFMHGKKIHALTRQNGTHT
jgi:hypothetical protein